MTTNSREFLKGILEQIAQLDYIKPDDLPNIDLYMDQVTTFMEEQLASTKRYPDDKILTKTMINNYAKNKLLPPPEKKRYSKEHLLMMLFIYYFKNILSIGDIKTLMGPITEKYFNAAPGQDLTYIYNEVFSMEKNRIMTLQKDLLKSWQVSEGTFSDADPQNQEFLQKFSFICQLSFDVYLKKMIIEHMIDEIAPPTENKKVKKEKAKKASPQENGQS